MATKMQTKSYLLGYCSTQDVECTNSWFGYYQDKKPSTHLCSNYVQSLVNRCDKEMLKHAMLEHETIFHNQLYELHRLYKTQKDLMTEFQTRALYGSSIVAEASHSNSFTSQMQSECLEKRSQTSHHVGNNSYGKAVLACNDKFHFSFTREDSVQSHPNPLLNGDFEKDSKELGPMKRKKFDLHLPAHVYIDIEDTDESHQKIFSELPRAPSIPKNATCSFSNENDAKLTIGSIHKEDQHVLNSLMQINILTCGMIDLNKPAKDVSSEGPSNSQSLPLLGLKTHSEPTQMYYSPVRSSTSISDRHCVQQTTSDYLCTDVLPKREWPLSRLECGRSSSSVDFLVRTSANSNTSAVMHGNLQSNTNTDRNNQSLPFAQCPGKWSGQKLSARVTHFNGSAPASVTAPQAGLTSYAPAFVSSWAKPSTSTNDKSSVVQALPFHPSSNPSNESLFIANQIPITCEKSGSSRNSIPGLEHGILVSCTNLFCHGTHHCSDATHLKHRYVKQDQNDHHNQTVRSNLPKHDQNAYLRRDLGTSMNINLNRAYLEVTEDRHCVRVDTSDHLAESQYGKLSLPSWFNGRTYFDSNDSKKLAAEVDFSFLNRRVQLSSRIHAGTLEREEERFISGKEEHVNNSTKILKTDDNMIFTDLGFDAKVTKSERKTYISDLYGAICDGKNRERVRSHINLNVEFPCVDHPMPSEKLHDCEILASSHSSPSFSAKTDAINLEAPISQSEMGSLNQHNHIPSCKKVDSEELIHSGKSLQLAAQNLINLSMDCRNCLAGITPNMLVKPTCDTLSWFAEVVVSCSAENPNLISDGVDRSTQSSGDDGFDLFEAMTLNLKEIKMDQSSLWEINNKDEKKDMEDTGTASMLFTKPRHGQARKRRQRRDFQNDILPGLASLSRHEVTEDLQNIGEMMKASGRPWQTGSTRRNKCRNGMKSQTCRQPRNLAITIGEVQISERSMIGWGRTTTRFRRQRCPPGGGLPAST